MFSHLIPNNLLVIIAFSEKILLYKQQIAHCEDFRLIMFKFFSVYILLLMCHFCTEIYLK